MIGINVKIFSINFITNGSFKLVVIFIRKNIELRKLINDKRIKFYEIASEIGIAPTTFTIWMRDELTEDKKKKVMNAIDSLLN